MVKWETMSRAITSRRTTIPCTRLFSNSNARYELSRSALSAKEQRARRREARPRRLSDDVVNWTQEFIAILDSAGSLFALHVASSLCVNKHSPPIHARVSIALLNLAQTATKSTSNFRILQPTFSALPRPTDESSSTNTVYPTTRKPSNPQTALQVKLVARSTSCKTSCSNSPSTGRATTAVTSIR
jgi:hypothetical protein